MNRKYTVEEKLISINQLFDEKDQKELSILIKQRKKMKKIKWIKLDENGNLIS